LHHPLLRANTGVIRRPRIGLTLTNFPDRIGVMYNKAGCVLNVLVSNQTQLRCGRPELEVRRVDACIFGLHVAALKKVSSTVLELAGGDTNLLARL
jgi:hypothetical protein